VSFIPAAIARSETRISGTRRRQLGRRRRAHGREEVGEQPVEVLTDFGDGGVVVGGEQRAGLVDGQMGAFLGVGVDDGAQGCVEHDRRVVVEHALGDGVVAHQVLGALPARAGPGHDRGDVAPPVDHESERGVDGGLLEDGIPGGELAEAV